MLKKKELLILIISAILMALILSFYEMQLQIDKFLSFLLISIIIIFSYCISKKITAKVIDLEIEYKFWELKRYWFSAYAYLKKPIPMGLIFPLLLSILSNGYIKFLAFMQYESKALPGRFAKKSGIREWDDALLVFYSVLPLLILSLVANYIGGDFFYNLAKYSLFFIISNMIPISKLDGTRIFFGSKPLFIFSWTLILITSIFILL